MDIPTTRRITTTTNFLCLIEYAINRTDESPYFFLFSFHSQIVHFRCVSLSSSQNYQKKKKKTSLKIIIFSLQICLPMGFYSLELFQFLIFTQAGRWEARLGPHLRVNIQSTPRKHIFILCIALSIFIKHIPQSTLFPSSTKIIPMHTNNQCDFDRHLQQ